MKPILDILRSGSTALRLVFDVILPERCALCLLPDEGGFCLDCQALLPWIESACLRCGCRLSIPGTCGQCQQRLVGRGCAGEISETVVPFRYDHPVSGHIQQLKYQGTLSTVPALAGMLAQHALVQSTSLPDALVPVPLHFRRLRQRGFNQASLLADAVGRLLDIPVDHRLLIRNRDTPSQTDLDERQREKNMRRAFQLSTGHTYRSIALIDDVITSGATVRSACATITGHSDTRVSAWAVAKT